MAPVRGINLCSKHAFVRLGKDMHTWPPVPWWQQDPILTPLGIALPFCMQALWDFGGRMRQVQSDWKRLQEEIRTTPKRPRTDPGPTYSGPLLLLNQYYWEQGLGAGINSIKGDNMFGINMYGSYSSICQDMLSSSPAVNNFAPCNSSSNGDRDSTTGANRNNAATAQERVQGARPQHKQQKRAQAETHEEVVAESSDIVPAAANRRASTDSSSIADLPASDMAPAAAPTDAYDLEEIEAVCRQQNLTHLPASRRFIRALKIIRAAKQQAEQQQAQAQVALGQPSLPLVAVV